MSILIPYKNTESMDTSSDAIYFDYYADQENVDMVRNNSNQIVIDAVKEDTNAKFDYCINVRNLIVLIRNRMISRKSSLGG